MPHEQQPEADAVSRVDEVTAALADLAGVLVTEEDLGRGLQRNMEMLVRAVPGADMASVSVLHGETAETVASSSERVWSIDSDQYAAGDGPCLQAARTGEVVRTGVAEARRRWPEFSRSARGAGVQSYLSCPLIVDEKFAGSLNLYSEHPHGFADFDVALLRLYATAACAAIGNARRYARVRTVAGQLEQALDSRAVIDQAIGVLMARRQITAAEAMAELSRQSQQTNVKLRDIAARLVGGLSQPDSGP
jgi:GAF domain-containing protein